MKCKKCLTEVANRDTVCPGCGAPLNKGCMTLIVLSSIVIFGALLLIAILIGGKPA